MVCQPCGREFLRKYAAQTYCSYACKVAAQRKSQKPTITNCLCCGKEFLPHYTSTGKYCSTVCYHKATIKHPRVFACETCGTQFTPGVGCDLRNRRFCFRTCMGIAKRAKRNACPRCGKTLNRQRKFCSELCRRPIAICTCIVCGHEFRRGPNEAKTRRFCSNSCYHRHKGETSIELLMRIELDRLNMPFEQWGKVGRYSVDFLLPEWRIALEVDGTYWHRNPERDKRKTRNLAKQGWTVLRVREAEIKSHGAQRAFSDALQELRDHSASPVPTPSEHLHEG